MDKVSIIGGGAWGTTLAQVLTDNNIDVLIYDVNDQIVDKINNSQHPFFQNQISNKIKATTNLKDLIEFSSLFLIVTPSKYVREVAKNLKKMLKNNKIEVVSATKGIEPSTGFPISKIVKEELKENLKHFATLTGPSHAEDVILRKITLLTAASTNIDFAKKIQHLFSNKNYLRVYRSSDLVAAEFAGSAKNAISLISGISTGLKLGENARAALITRGLHEIVRVVKKLGGTKKSVYGLTGLGDLIVTASSTKSRNFNAGINFAKGLSAKQIEEKEQQTVEGFRAIKALDEFSKKNNLSLPIINIANRVVNNEVSLEDGIKYLLSRNLIEE